METRLRRLYRSLDPDVAPPSLRATVRSLPVATPRRRFTIVEPLLGLAAAVTLALLALSVGRSALVGEGPATGTSPSASPSFDPAQTGIGIAPANVALGPWLLVIVAVVTLTGFALARRSRRTVPLLAVAGAVLGYALYASLAPIELRVTGEGPGLHIQAAPMPPGASETFYYELAPPNEPFTFGILLIGGDANVRIEGLVRQEPSAPGTMGWRAVWLDREPNGGMTGPAVPFHPFTMAAGGQSIWLVGRASSCAIGRIPATGEDSGGFASRPTIVLNVSYLGWPRTVEVPMPKIAEPQTDPCDLAPGPGSSHRAVGPVGS